jgi:predicted thioesterase
MYHSLGVQIAVAATKSDPSGSRAKVETEVFPVMGSGTKVSLAVVGKLKILT